MIPDPPPLLRPGLPLDPQLQLDRGELSAPVDIVVPVSGLIQALAARPLRVALYVAPVVTGGAWSLWPGQPPAGAVGATSLVSVPMYLHCRDYPGLVQGEWWVLAGFSDRIRVWEYFLNE